MDINNTKEIKELWKEVIRLHGETAAFRKVKEEMAEMIVAISHVEDGKANTYDILDELVDIVLQAEKMLAIFDDEKHLDFYNKTRQKKYDNLERMIYG